MKILCSYLQTEAESQFRKTGEKTVTVGYKLDIVFHLIRMGLFYMDHDLITRNLEKAQRSEKIRCRIQIVKTVFNCA